MNNENTLPERYDRFIVRSGAGINNSEKVSVNRIGDLVETMRVAVNLVQLKPGSRSSLPHAESSEEEFVYVLKGKPTVWLDGKAYALHEGHAVGFPSGDGLCHTLINDSNSSVELLVLGERSKKENQWVYPLNPEKKDEVGQQWWSDWPARDLGTHPGIPHSNLKAEENAVHPAIFYAPNGDREDFSYKGDNETFSLGHRLSDTLKLKKLGIWHEILPAGKRTSWPHSQLKEEEFAFVLKGSPSVWLNGWTQRLSSGDFVYFKPGAGIAHTIINNTRV